MKQELSHRPSFGMGAGFFVRGPCRRDHFLTFQPSHPGSGTQGINFTLSPGHAPIKGRPASPERTSGLLAGWANPDLSG